MIATALLSVLLSLAQTAPQATVCIEACSYSGEAGDVRLALPDVEDPPMSVDGALEEPAWKRAARLTGFTQYQPIEGASASQRTEVLVFRTDDDLYFGVMAHDSEPEGVRATLAERDNIVASDDYVRIILDTFHDQRRAYSFAVNPLGIQQDGLWLEGGTRAMQGGGGSGGGGGGGGGRGGGRSDPVDDNQDFIWESRGRILSWGYQVEIRVPLKSLRFPAETLQDWGLQVLRVIQRDGFRESWAPLTAESTNRLAQSGTIERLAGLDPGLFLELNPVVTGLRSGAYDLESASMVRGDPDMEFGLNATYGLTSNLTLDATYNPDFSQVEADAGQIAVNERFALFFPEKRPFFLEGTELFEMPVRLAYTRSIVDPVVGAKLSGKVGGLSLGYLGAADEAVADDGNAIVNLLRLRTDLGTSSTLGLLYTDRTQDSEEYNRVLGTDARLVLGQRYTLTLVSAVSRTGTGAGADAGDGLLLRAGLDRAGRNFMYNLNFQSISSAFQARSGFLDREDDASVFGQIRYRWYFAADKVLERVSPFLNFQSHWDDDDFWAGEGVQEWEAALGAGVGFRGNWGFNINANLSGFEFAPADYEGLFVEGAAGGLEPFRPDQSLFAGLRGLSGRLRLDTWEKVRGQLQINWRETPVFERSLGVPVEMSRSLTVDASYTVFPTSALQAELGLRRSGLDHRTPDGRHSSATIPRVRAQYQFTRALFLRTIFEYDSEDRGGLRDPLTGRNVTLCEEGTCDAQVSSESHLLYGEVLLSFEPSPGTVFFLGYSRQMDDPSSFSFSELTSREDGLFLKGSYRFRL